METLAPALVREELEKVLASPQLARSENLRDLLRYLVEQALAGRQEQLKESVLGVEVFGRTAGWNPKVDSVVRTHSARLRDKLREYYLADGREDPIVIEIPKGSYSPRWRNGAARKHRLQRGAWIAAALVAAGLGGVVFWMGFRAPVIRSVAVLPLRNLDGNPASEPLADGLTEDLIRYLTGLPRIRVVSPTSSFALKGKNTGLREIGSLLDVDAVVEGSLRQDGGQVKLAAQLTRVSDGRILWAGAFEREPRDLFSVEEELASAVAQTLRPSLERTVSAARSMDPEAYQLYMRGLAAYLLFTEESLPEAIRYFERAAEKDPGSVRPWTALARSFNRVTREGQLTRREAAEKMRAATRRALEIDARSAEAHAYLGVVYSSVDANDRAAEGEFRRALELNQNEVGAWAWYAWFLANRGRTRVAVEAQRHAVRLDPLAPEAGNWLAMMYYLDRRYAEAIAENRRVLERNPEFRRAYDVIGNSYLAMGKCGEALEAFRLRAAGPNVYARARCGDPQPARQALPGMEAAVRAGRGSPRAVARIYVALGDKQRALDWLEVVERERSAGHNLSGPVWDPLRGEPRFQALRKRFGRGD